MVRPVGRRDQGESAGGGVVWGGSLRENDRQQLCRSSVMNLVLAILWFVGGVALIAWHGYTGGQGGQLRIGGYSLSMGWLMLLLSAYNLIRWRGGHNHRAERDFRLALARRRDSRFHDRPPTERVIDPTFDFTRDPPSSGHGD
jgi:hypothetical protein